MPTELIELEMRILGAEEMCSADSKGNYPDGSVWVCAFGTDGSIKARLGMCQISMVAGVDVEPGLDADQLILEMMKRLESFIVSRSDSRALYTLITPNGGELLAEKSGWNDTGLKVYAKAM